jgi:probable poly-beta-1,6-N-acetyl-D-glucosamine export protein
LPVEATTILNFCESQKNPLKIFYLFFFLLFFLPYIYYAKYNISCQGPNSYNFTMEILKQKKYNPVIDLLRFICILAVISIHVTTRLIEASGFALQKVPLALFFNQISRFAVPLFFLISGFVLELNYSFHSNYFSYLKKRVNRLFIPYIAWSAIYYYFLYTNHTRSFLSSLLDGSASYQLYFIPSLLLLYIFFPLIHKFYDFFANKWTLIFLGILQLGLLYQDYYLSPLLFIYPIKIVFLNYYVFILGIVASRNMDYLMSIVDKFKISLIILTIFLGNYVFFEGRTFYLATRNYLYFYSQWRISVLLYTLLFGGLSYYLLNKVNLSESVVKKLSGLSFFVFFIHVIVLEFIWKYIGVYVGQFWFGFTFFLMVSGFSFLLAYLAHKVPLLSKLTA